GSGRGAGAGHHGRPPQQHIHRRAKIANDRLLTKGSCCVEDRLLHRRELFVGGAWVPPAGGECFDVISPSTEEAVGEAPLATVADIDAAVGAARTAFDDGAWPRTTPGERADVLAHV